MAIAVYAYDGFSKNKVFFSKNINPNQNYNNQNQIPNNDFSKTRVLQKENVSSGRFLIWNSLFHYYEFKNLFGYGIQADRYLLKSHDITYTNASNGFIYAFICGGYFSFFILLIIFLINVKYIFTYYFKNIIKNTYDYIGLLSFFILIFFSIRIFFENSFSLFSLDFILFLLSSLILKKKITN